MKAKFSLILTLLLIINLQLSAQKREKKLEEFGNTFNDAVQRQDEALLATFFNSDEFIDRIIVEGKSKDLKSYNKGFTSSVTKAPMLNRLILQSTADGSNSYDLIRTYYKGKEPHMIFRLSGDGGMNYHDLLLQPKGRNDFEVIDIYVYLTGEYLTETIQRLYLSGGKDYFLAEDVEDLPSIDMATLNSMLSLKQFIDQQDFNNANEVLNQLSDDLRQEKLFKLYELTIKANLDQESYVQTLKEYGELFPNDASAYLISLDYLFINEEYEELLKNIDKLDKQVGGDAYLNLYRANAYYFNDQSEKAEPLFRQVMEEFPYDVEPPFSLLDLLIMGKRYEESIELLYELCDRFDIAEQDMTTIIEDEPTYKSFTQSPEFAKWKEDNK